MQKKFFNLLQVSSFLWLIKGGSTIYSILLLGIVLNFLSLEEYGIYALLTVIINLSDRFINWGFLYGSVHLKQHHENESDFLTSIFLSKLILFAIFCFFIYSFQHLGIISIPQEVFFFVFFFSFSSVINFVWYYQLNQNNIELLFPWMTGYSFISFFLIFLLVSEDQISLNQFIVISLMPNYIYFLLLTFKVSREINLFKLSYKLLLNKSIITIKKNFNLALTNLIPAGYINLIPILISIYSIDDLGRYNFLLRISQIAKSLIIQMNQVAYFQLFSQLRKDYFKFSLYIIGIIFTICISYCFFVYKAIPYVASDNSIFLNSSFDILSLFFIVLIGSLANYFVSTLFYSTKNEKMANLITIFSIIFIMSFASYFVVNFGYNVGVISYILVEFLLLILWIYFGLKFLKNS